MNNQKNYSKELDKLIAAIPHGTVPSLLLHACCAPCSSYVLEYLSQYFTIILLYYNPNIAPYEEYQKREKELRRLIGEMPLKHSVSLVPGTYDAAVFDTAVQGLEDAPEGGARCMVCYELRMREAASEAKRLGCDYFASTLSISPMKHAGALGAIGEKLAAEYGVSHLSNDFKKKDGYKRSIALSREYSLYRQDFCGCIYSKKNREEES